MFIRFDGTYFALVWLNIICFFVLFSLRLDETITWNWWLVSIPLFIGTSLMAIWPPLMSIFTKLNVDISRLSAKYYRPVEYLISWTLSLPTTLCHILCVVRAQYFIGYWTTALIPAFCAILVFFIIFLLGLNNQVCKFSIPLKPKIPTYTPRSLDADFTLDTGPDFNDSFNGRHVFLHEWCGDSNIIPTDDCVDSILSQWWLQFCQIFCM